MTGKGCAKLGVPLQVLHHCLVSYMQPCACCAGQVHRPVGFAELCPFHCLSCTNLVQAQQVAPSRAELPNCATRL